MTNKEPHRGFGPFGTIVIIIVTAIITSMATGIIMFNNASVPGRAGYTDLSNDASLKEFLEVYASILSDYYEDVNKEELINQAISAMFNYLGEPYSQHMTKEQTENLAQRLQGEYEGVGIQISSGNVIYEVFADSPASKAGILVNDVIVAINGESVTEKSITEVADLIKNSSGTIALTMKREDTTFVANVAKEKMYIPSIESEVYEENGKTIGYLKIKTFSSTLTEQVSKALVTLEKKNIYGLVIDIRGNSGGYLSGANGVASLFLEKGKIIYSLENKEDKIITKDETDEKRTYPIVIVMDENSASASEILAGALSQSYGATLVGTKSYGKGKVQQTLNLDDGSMIKYTSSKWLTPNGECIDGVGLKPDYEVYDDTATEADEQLLKAYELLK